MATIVTRSGKGSPLTNTEVDANFTNLNNDKLETNAEVRAAVEAASDSNVFTDADHTKLDAIEANATADQTAAEILTAIKTVDGTGSGLDADTLDGVEAAALLPLSGGTMTGNLVSGDNVKATFGDGDDLQIYHDGSNSYIKDAGTGVLTVQSNQVRFQNAAGTEDVAFFNQDAAVKLYYDSAKKFETTSYGTLFTGNSKWVDNGKATFGDGDDLQIYHDGSSSIIRDAGTGNLRIWAEAFSLQKSDGSEQMIYATPDDSVILYYNGNTKFFTTNSGVSVTGNVIATGTVEPAGDTAAGDNAAVGYTSAEGLILTGQGSTSDITFKNDADATVFSIPTGSDDILFPDNAKALFGDGSDLEISHTGSTSVIKDVGTGGLTLSSNGYAVLCYDNANSNNMAEFITGAGTKLYYNGNLKLEVKNASVAITGAVKPTTYQETYVAKSAASTVTCDLATGTSFSVTLDQNTTFAFTNPPSSGTAFSFTLFITQHSTAVMLNWPGTVDWAGGSAPDAAAANEVQAYGFFTRDGGTTYYGFLGGSALG